MSGNKLYLAAAVSLALACQTQLANAAACPLSDWSNVVGSISAGNPTATPRYAGICALSANNNFSYVVDESPNAEPVFNTRFYFYTGNRSADATIFQARTSTGAAAIQVRHNGATNQLTFSAAGTSQTRTISVQDNRWYGIRMEWTAGSGGSLAMQVQGGGTPAVVLTPLSGLSNSSTRVDSVRLGLVDGTGTGTVAFDAYESLRSGVAHFLCRGDAVPDNTIDSADLVAISQETFQGQWATGQADIDENGVVDSADYATLQFRMDYGGVDC